MQLWRSRRWRELLLLIDWLPRNSAYMEALSDDEELAEQVLRDQKREQKNGKDRDRPGRSGPRISEFSVEVERLTDLVDRMSEAIQATVASAGGKPPRMQPQPRPVTAMQRLQEKERYAKHRRTVSRVLIQREDGTTVPLAELDKPAPAPAPKPAIAPGEDPYRFVPPRRRKPAEPPPA